MKSVIFTVLVCVQISMLFAQSVGISNAAITPDASSILEVQSTNKGVLLPRVALTGTTDNTTIASPATSLLIYNTATAGSGPTAVNPGYYYWDGAQRMRFMNSGRA